MKSSFAEYNISQQQLASAAIFKELYFERTGFFENAFSHRMARTNPDFYMVFVCVGGKGTLTLENRSFDISAGDVFFTFPHLPHLYAADENEPWSIYWAHFYAPHQSVPGIFEACGISAEHPGLHIRSFGEIADLFKTVFSDLYKCSAAELMYRQSVFVHMLFRIVTLASSQNRKDPYVTKALEYIHGNPDKYISLDILADICGVSKYYLSHMFTEQTGVSVKQYILLAYFADEIVDTILTIGGTPYNWILNSELPPLDFANFNSVLLTILGICANGAVALIALILILILAWNYIKLLFEAAERYVLLGVLVYTAPVAFAMGASQTTSGIFKSWCRMFGGQVFLLLMNAWCLRLFKLLFFYHS